VKDEGCLLAMLILSYKDSAFFLFIGAQKLQRLQKSLMTFVACCKK
jgi:hypothetical protein